MTPTEIQKFNKECGLALGWEWALYGSTRYLKVTKECYENNRHIFHSYRTFRRPKFHLRYDWAMLLVEKAREALSHYGFTIVRNNKLLTPYQISKDALDILTAHRSPNGAQK